MPEPISYTLHLLAPETHYVEVEATFPSEPLGTDHLDLAMAVWTPGSYLVREFARNVESVAARDTAGRPLTVCKVTKNRWRIAGIARGCRAVTVTWRLYCREMSVRSNYVDDRFALLNGAATFLTVAEALAGAGEPRAHEVRLKLPAGWARSITTLAPGDGSHHYRAESFDQLVDSPFYAGNPAIYEEEVEGVVHRLVNEGEGGIFDGRRAAADMVALARTQKRFWGFFPYPSYTFFNLLTESHGGLEHESSSVLMASRLATRSREKYLEWLGLASHELFHAWNGKRLRPVELGPFDYQAEVYTESLWLVEGVTAYYDDLLVHRAGLSTREEFLKAFSKAIERVESTPGRRIQSLTESSFDTWINLYRRDENTPNRGISYYPKGAVVAWLLDVEIRRGSGGARSLDDLLCQAWERHSGERGYDRGEIEALASEVAGVDLADFFRRTVEGRGDLDYAPALSWLGLRFKPVEPEKAGEAEASKAWLGIETEAQNGAVVVAKALRGAPGFAAGLSAEDEILAVDGYRITPSGWEEHLRGFRPGDRAEVLIARHKVLRSLRVTFGEKPPDAFKLEVDPRATPEQTGRLAAWLGRADPAPDLAPDPAP